MLRTCRRRGRVLSAAGTVVLALLACRAIVAQTYVTMEIDASNLGGSNVRPRDVNNLSQIVGVYEAADGTDRAFVSSGGVLTEPDPGFPGFSRALAINDSGRVVGEAEDLDGDVIAFRWLGSGRLILMTVFEGQSVGGFESTARDINASGTIAGWAFADTQFGVFRRAFLMEGFVAQELGSLGGFNSFANGINDLGQVVGQADSSFPNLIPRAFLWKQDPGMVQLETATSDALGVNVMAKAVGWQLGSGDFRATRWTLTPDNQSSETLLGTLGGDSESIARSINTEGVIVGNSFGGAAGSRAVLWGTDGIMDLNELLPPGSGWVLRVATAINDLGQIVGSGMLDGQLSGFLLSPIFVEYIDPVPALLDGPLVTTDIDRLGAALGPKVVGLVGDGVTPILLRITGLPGPGTVDLSVTDELGDRTTVGRLRTPGNREDVTSLSVPTVQVADGRHLAFALLVAPEDFVRGAIDHSEDLRKITLNAFYTQDGPGTAMATTQTIDLRRPPVLLLHGLWSKESTWKWKLEQDSRFTVYRHDYSATAADSFEVNVVQPRWGVQAALDKARSQSLAATQADVVAHSMGGVLTRIYVGEDLNIPDAVYRRDENFLEGDVNRVITMGAPHLGTPIADLLMAWAQSPTTPAEKAVEFISEKLGCVNCGAIKDLQTTGVILNSLGPANVPAHALAGTGGADVVVVVDALLFSLLLHIPPAFAIPSELVFAPGADHDLLVERTSAEGGLPAGSGQVTVIPFMPPQTYGIHTDMPKQDINSTPDRPSAFIRDTVIDLLNTPVTDTSTYAGGFPPTGGGGGASGGFPLPPYGDLVSGLVIADPPPGTIVNPGDVLTVTVDTIDGFAPDRVLLASRLDSEVDDTAPYTLDLQIPANAIGTMTLTALGLDVGLNLAVSEEITIQIDVLAALTGIDFVQDAVFLYGFGPELQAHVVGTYDDGVERDLTDPQLGTTYSSLDPGIVTVDASGLVTAVAVGVATIEAANGPHTATMRVHVKSTVCPADVNGDGHVNVLDLIDLLLCFGQPANPPCNTADMNQDGTVDELDLIEFLPAFGTTCL